MDNQLTRSISIEINELIHKHMGELQNYFNCPISQDLQPSDTAVALFGRLAEICDEPADHASFEMCLDAQGCLDQIRSFLAVFNQEVNVEFEATKAGQLFVLGTRWYEQATKDYSVPMNYVWDFIAPVIPDHMEQLDRNTFEAQWWSPVPVMDIEILQRTEGITILAAPQEPKHLPGGVSVQFKLALAVRSED